jgi:hypothetical protein
LLAGVVGAGAVRAGDGGGHHADRLPDDLFAEPAHFRQPAGELGTSADRIDRTYLDSGAEE